MNEAFYKTILNESPSAYAFHKIILDQVGQPCDYEFLEVNAAFERYTGLKSANIIGKKITEIIPHIGTTEYNWIKAYGHVALTGETLDFIQFSDGLGHWYKIKAYSPEKYYFIVRFTDISVEAEQQKALQNFFDISPDLLCITDKDGCFFKTNASWGKALGYSEADLKSTKYSSYVHPDDEQNTISAMRRLQNQKEIVSFVNRFRKADGEYRYMEWSARLEGETAYVTGRDITEKMEEEVKIKKLLAESETVFNATQDGLFMLRVDEAGYSYIKNNAAYEKLSGIHSIQGKTPEDLWGSELAKKITDNYDCCVEQKKAVTYEEILPLPAGDRIVLTTLTPILEDGKTAFIVGSRRDITDEKKAEEEIRQNLLRSEAIVRVLQRESSSIQEYLDFALGQALGLTNSKYGYIYFYDEKTKLFTLNTWSDGVIKDCRGKDPSDVFDLKKTGAWRAVRQRKPVIVNDFKDSNSFKKGYPEGHIEFTRFVTVPLLIDGKIVAVVGTADKEKDYTEMDVLQLDILMHNAWKEVLRKQSEAMLFEEKERLRVTLLSVGDGVIATDSEGNITIMNTVAEKLTGWNQEELGNRAFSHVFHIINEYTREKCENPVEKVMETGKVVGLANHTILIARDGTERPIADSAAPIMENGVMKGVILVFRDVTIQRQKQAMIEHLSFHDQLTDLFNRRFFEEEIHRLDMPRNFPLAIIMADVNGLKLTNDAFGHKVGDMLLMKAADAMQACCRRDDMIARLGGDEFVILLPRTGKEDAEEIAKKIVAQCSYIRVDAVSLSISCGFAVKYGEEKIYDVLKKAEDMMYRRKLFEGPSIRGQIIDAVVKALYEANRREKEHSERVSLICEKMGHALGCSERVIQELRTAGLLHDIGKVAVDVAIIDKPGRLTENEWIEVKRHPEIGYRILSGVNDMSEIAQSVLSHHERWDGTGYPRGISGEAIPIYARILAIADAYDAMTCERPYRDPLPAQKVKSEMILNRGRQFDARLVDIFLQQVAPALR